jgi:hypothetical protein
MRTAVTNAIGFLLPLLLACQACASPRPAFRAGAVEHGKLHHVDGFWVLELDGTAAERGKAAGLLVGEQVRWLLPRQLKKIAGVDRLSPAPWAITYRRRAWAVVCSATTMARYRRDQSRSRQS